MMGPLRPLSGEIQLYLVLFASFTLAALQNVTVDDAVLTGAVVPQYLPTASLWNSVVGNNCTSCTVKPDPSLAYDGTWHDTTYYPSNDYTPSFQFTFTGSALYIFFIIANNLNNSYIAFTSVQFELDEVLVSTYTHTPSTSTDYQYNVLVYANSSMTPGQHTMVVVPAVNTGNRVLVLFDYLIYTMDTSSSLSTSSSTQAFTSAVTATSVTGTSPASNIGAIVGGTVGGVTALVLAIASLLCYRSKRYKGRRDDRPEEGAAVEPYRDVPPTRFIGTPLRSKVGASTVVPQPSTLPASTAPSGSSSGALSSGNSVALLEQVELLRGEVARLRNLQDSERNSVSGQSEAPPEYS
ncbi:hypothetical protein V8E55_010574 [Tylopilus felleus]